MKYYCKYLNFHFFYREGERLFSFSFLPVGDCRWGVAYYAGEKAEILERTDEYKRGIVFRGEEGAEPTIVPDKPAVVYEVEFSDVRTNQQAKEILRKEPYNVPASKLETRAEILAVADELKVNFPLLKQ